MQTVTYKAKLLVQQYEPMGYITYVFENLDYENEENKYLMCVRFPNWEHCNLIEEEIGYVSIVYVEAGVDKWFDGRDFNYYNYTNYIFSKFVKDNKQNLDEIVLD